MVLEPERLLRTGAGVFESKWRTYNLATVGICEHVHQVRAEKLTHIQ